VQERAVKPFSVRSFTGSLGYVLQVVVKIFQYFKLFGPIADKTGDSFSKLLLQVASTIIEHSCLPYQHTLALSATKAKEIRCHSCNAHAAKRVTIAVSQCHPFHPSSPHILRSKEAPVNKRTGLLTRGPAINPAPSGMTNTASARTEATMKDGWNSSPGPARRKERAGDVVLRRNRMISAENSKPNSIVTRRKCTSTGHRDLDGPVVAQVPTWIGGVITTVPAPSLALATFVGSLA